MANYRTLAYVVRWVRSFLYSILYVVHMPRHASFLSSKLVIAWIILWSRPGWIDRTGVDGDASVLQTNGTARRATPLLETKIATNLRAFTVPIRFARLGQDPTQPFIQYAWL